MYVPLSIIKNSSKRPREQKTLQKAFEYCLTQFLWLFIISMAFSYMLCVFMATLNLQFFELFSY